MCVADVTGHGAEVAEFSGWLEEAFSAHIHRASPAGVLRAVNKRATKRGLEVMSTGICLSYNSLNGTLRYCSAGHPPIRLRRADGHEWEPLTLPRRESPWNLPMGIDEQTRFDVGRIQLRSGDQLLIYTDGLTEAHDPQGRQLGDTMWNASCLRDPNVSTDDRAHGLRELWSSHTGESMSAQDDLTLAVLECLPYQAGNRYSLFLRNNLLHRR
jgi:sigma-B regulation protein RsbU (phosphoserine phosphatase)